ncbi:MAG: succinylglutamate desuccinylase/aspartoacylase family protein [Phaeodactylibacter sp.]|uniref:succinylglutamate desuccinylase/aspartoacylase family protein n=1 Tax=Phaeodactylibacter sp. TaxID=1940289 RepID=UPI0032EC2922
MYQSTTYPVLADLDLSSLPAGTVQKYWLPIITDGIGAPVRLPVLIAKGKTDGPVVGLTAAIHGNELNGIPVIQRLFTELDAQRLTGTVVGVPVMNIPGLMLEQRKFNDGVDLNRIAPGDPDGNLSQVYIYRLIERVLRHFDYLIDLHTASAGRINSWYIRADMSQPATARMAILQNPEIILHNLPNDGTFRGAAADLGIPAITLELRDPHVFQRDVIKEALIGVWNVLFDLNMLEGAIRHTVDTTWLCRQSNWLYTDEGGILTVRAGLGQVIGPGDTLAEVRSVFGTLTKTYSADRKGVVIGKSVSPINPTGSRILHLGYAPESIPCKI